MIEKYCVHCGTRNIFEITPKFCCGCGKPFNKAVASVHVEEEEEEETPSFDVEKMRKDVVCEYDKEEHFPKFGDNIAKEQGRYDRRAEAAKKPPFQGDAIQKTREDCTFNGTSKSIG